MDETGQALMIFVVQNLVLALGFAACWSFFKAMSR